MSQVSPGWAMGINLMKASGRSMRLVALAMAMAIALGCVGDRPSAVQPSHINTPDDAVWFDPDNQRFLVVFANGHEFVVAQVSGSTQFTGPLHSVLEMSWVYAKGFRVRVRVDTLGVASHDAWTARTVVAQAVETDLFTFGTVAEQVAGSDPEFGRLLLSDSRLQVFVTPSTTLDPTGDFTIYDDLMAALERGDVMYVSGDGWLVGVSCVHARMIKATREPR